MWKRDEAPRPSSGREAATPAPATPSGPVSTAAAGSMPPAVPRHSEGDIVNIGKSVVIKGELNGSEDLLIEGRVEGKIELRDNVLTVGPNGKIKAQIVAKAVIVLGEVIGNMLATEKVDIRNNGSVEGDIVSPRVAIAEGAVFRGSVDMQRSGKPAPTRSPMPGEPKGEAKSPVATAPPAPTGSSAAH